MSTIEIIDQVKKAAIASACSSVAGMAFSEKTVVGIVCRGSKPITGKFGPTAGQQIQKATTNQILVAHASKSTASAYMKAGGRIEASGTKLDWYPVETLDAIEQRSRALLGDALYDLCQSNLQTTSPNREKWAQMLLCLAEWLELTAALLPTGEGSENESLAYAARLHRRLAAAK